MDFFTVPTLRFRVLHCFFVVEHGRLQDPPIQRYGTSNQLLDGAATESLSGIAKGINTWPLGKPAKREALKAGTDKHFGGCKGQIPRE